MVPDGAAAASGAPNAAEKKHLKLWSHTVTRRIIQACIHVFGADGSHMSFRKPNDIMKLPVVKAKLDLAEDLAYTTVNDWLKKEEAVSNRNDII